MNKSNHSDYFAPTCEGSVRPMRHCNRDRGFSLLEMMVAMVVLSLSLGALYQAATGATRNVRVASEYTQAVMLAESMMAEHSFVTEENFSASGQFATYTWRVASWPVPPPDLSERDASAGERIDNFAPLQFLKVSVAWPGGSEDRQIELVTVVPLRVVESS